MIASQMTHFLSPSRLSNSILDTFITSISKSLVLAFIWILLLSFIFILFVYILGGAFNIKTSGNLNDMVTNGVCLLNGDKTNFSNIPTSFSNNVRAFLEVHKRSVSSTSNYTTQVLRSALYNDRARTFIRSGDGGIWEDWKEIAVDVPAFYKNYSTLAALMSGLNVNPVGNKVNVTGSQNVNLDNMDDGFYIGNNFHADAGAPAIAGLITQWSWTISGGKYAFQLLFSYDAKMYWRTCWVNVWQSWRKIEGTIVTTT